jgi:predicted MPP superfamily phosphohydrolase
MEEIKTGVFRIEQEIPIFIIGDIHGDYQCLLHCLVDLCKVVNIVDIVKENNKFLREQMEWKKNNNSIVIFCGDLIHRKRYQDFVLDDECSDIYIIETLLSLKKSAIENGGNILIISGNHEIMNITDPSNEMYTSEKNIKSNREFFTNKDSINKYIANSYAWVKLNDILIAHGGLCSEYLKFLDNENEFKSKKNNMVGGSKLKKKNIMIGGDVIEYGDDIIDFVNDKYRSFFKNYSDSKWKSDPLGHKLFISYNSDNKHEHNVFWCREWGYSGINCKNLDQVIKKVNCEKMIVAHCPQFLSSDKPKMINFECEDEKNSTENSIHYRIARVDLGMSRSFEYNKHDDFLKFLANNYHRKMSILKLSWDSKNDEYFFNYDSVISERLSCMQYLLIKYGISKNEWEQKNIYTDWIGFEYINKVLKDLDLEHLAETLKEDNIDNTENIDNSLKIDKSEGISRNLNNKNINSNEINKCNNLDDTNNVVLCFLYPLYNSRPNLNSVSKFNNYT